MSLLAGTSQDKRKGVPSERNLFFLESGEKRSATNVKKLSHFMKVYFIPSPIWD
jgi:hypothetical protein